MSQDPPVIKKFDGCRIRDRFVNTAPQHKVGEGCCRVPAEIETQGVLRAPGIKAQSIDSLVNAPVQAAERIALKIISRGNDTGFRKGLKSTEACFKTVRMPGVVGFKKSEEVTACMPEGELISGRDACVSISGMTEDADFVRILRGVLI